MGKNSQLHLEMQAEQHNRFEAAEQRQREEMEWGAKIECAQTTPDLQQAMLDSLRGMIAVSGCNPDKIEIIMSGIRYYGEAVRLEMMERRFDKPETFGSALPEAEQELINSIYGK